jgi:hypothetical protein
MSQQDNEIIADVQQFKQNIVKFISQQMIQSKEYNNTINCEKIVEIKWEQIVEENIVSLYCAENNTEIQKFLHEVKDDLIDMVMEIFDTPLWENGIMFVEEQIHLLEEQMLA